jgi:hypothetical protein
MKLSNSVRGVFFAFTTCTVGLGLFAVSGHAQNTQSKQAQKEKIVTQTAAVGPKTDANIDKDAIRPFRIDIPQEALADLRRRIVAIKWPERELVIDATQGVQLATMQKLAHYWATNYDWRNVEARLNALPQFITTIDGLDIHFIHVRSKHANALPVIITHGWPGSIIEQRKIIGPLTDPTAYGGTAEDAFDVVCPFGKPA